MSSRKQQHLYRDNRPIARRLVEFFITPESPLPKTADSLLCLGTDRSTKRELWLDREQITQHMLVLGTTSAGKTENLISLFGQAIASGGGGVFVDGKGDVALHRKIHKMAIELGREEELYVLNFMSFRGGSADQDASRQSNTIDLFSGDENSILMMLDGVMDDLGNDGAAAMWRGRAMAMLMGVVRALVWRRDEWGVKITLDSLRENIRLPKIVALADKTSGFPPVVRKTLLSYLTSLPGYVAENGANQSQTTKDQHAYLEMQFASLFGTLSDVYGHMFNSDNPEIDMKDIVLNRRILLVLLPALQKSEAELGKLGRIVTSLLRSMMAQRLGCTVDGRWAYVASENVNRLPFLCVFDEFSSYLGDRISLLAAQARSLDIGLIFSTQDVPELKLRSEHEAHAVMANTNTKIYMRTEIEHPGIETAELSCQSSGEFIVMSRDTVAYGESLFPDFRYGKQGPSLLRCFATAAHVENTRALEGDGKPAADIEKRVAALLAHTELAPEDWLRSSMAELNSKGKTFASAPGGHEGLLAAMTSAAGMADPAKSIPNVVPPPPVSRQMLDMMTGAIRKEEHLA